ncbi:MAG: 3-phosphoserine/phosphohydroxythreonine transaminase [Bacteroidia bacterium]
MSQQVHNFSAGPGILPREVIEQAAATVLDFNQSGLSLLEVSHRGKDFVAVMDEARNVVRRLLKLDDSYEVLFLQGGASLQFAMVPFNLLSTNGFAAYLNTGVWAKKAIKEAKMMGNVQVVASSEAQNFNYIPKQYDIPSDADYFHCTSNNTIYGTQMKAFPECKVPLVCDMSSDIFSKPFDASKFSLIYAGAQKNMGPAGATLVIVKKDILGKSGRKIPSMLDYQIHIEGESMYNTPPVFPIYASMLTLQWVEKNGGLAGAETRNNAKAQLLYNEIDRNGLFKGTAAAEDRSYMNATFVLKNPELEEQFNKLLKEAGISGLKGHRSVGGFRASIYNAMPMESVQVLVNVMQHFEKTLG